MTISKPKICIFELDEIIWDAKGSIFEREPPFKLLSKFKMKDSKGIEVTLDKHVFGVFQYLSKKNHFISISRYYQEEYIFKILRKFEIYDYLVFLTIEWDPKKQTFVKKVYDKESGNSYEFTQKDIYSVNMKSAYLSYIAGHYLQKKKYRNAIEYLKKSIASGSEIFEELFNIGRIYEENLTKHSEALVYYKKAVAIRPDNYEVHGRLGHVYVLLKKLDSGVEHLEKAWKLFLNDHTTCEDPKKTKQLLLCELGIAHETKGSLQKAKTHYKNALLADLKSDSTEDSIHNLVRLLTRMPQTEIKGNDLKLAKQIIKIISKELNKKKSFALCHHMALLHELIDDIPTAIKYYKYALIKKGNHQIYMRLGELYHKQNDIENAISYYERSQKLKQNAELANRLGILYESKDRISKAKESYEHALQINPKEKKARKNLKLLNNRLSARCKKDQGPYST